MASLKCKSGHIISLLKTLQGSHLMMACKALHDPYYLFQLFRKPSFPLLTLLQPHGPSCHPSATLDTLLTPLHMLFPLSGTFFPPLATRFSPSPLDFCSNVTFYGKLTLTMLKNCKLLSCIFYPPFVLHFSL